MAATAHKTEGPAVFKWRRVVLQLLLRQEAAVRAAAFSNAPVFETTSPMQTANASVRVVRRPKDPSMPGLARLTRSQLLSLCEQYLVPSNETEGKTNEQLRNMLYNVEPVRPQADYVEKVPKGSRKEKDASIPKAATRIFPKFKAQPKRGPFTKKESVEEFHMADGDEAWEEDVTATQAEAAEATLETWTTTEQEVMLQALAARLGRSVG